MTSDTEMQFMTMVENFCGSEPLTGRSDHSDVFQVHRGRSRGPALSVEATDERSAPTSWRDSAYTKKRA